MNRVVHLSRLRVHGLDNESCHATAGLLFLHQPNRHQRLTDVQDVVRHLELGDCGKRRNAEQRRSSMSAVLILQRGEAIGVADKLLGFSGHTGGGVICWERTACGEHELEQGDEEA